jgi:SAM-dependent methyltransferase
LQNPTCKTNAALKLDMPVDQSALKPVFASPIPCKICGGAAALFGVVDFHKACEEVRGLRLLLSGVPIYYRRCATCGFLFTDAFDCWTHDQFKEHIYNDHYYTVDPDYLTLRPGSNAGFVIRLWDAIKGQTRVLDYGGGNNALCKALLNNGFAAAVNYDPMVPEYAERPPGKFDLVTCFETLEHMPDPNAGISQILDCVAEPGLIVYSTLLQPANFDKMGVNWWYVGPRNGHVSIFTKQALAIAWGRYGYKTIACNDNLHLAFRTLPTFFAHLQSKADSLSIQTSLVPSPAPARELEPA